MPCTTPSGSTAAPDCSKIRLNVNIGHEQVENELHLGVAATPADPTQDILPSKGWDKLMETIQKIGGLPGAARVRERLMTASPL